MDISYKIVRRPLRRTTAISISPDNEIRILAPLFTSQSDIDLMIKKHIRWIQKKVEDNKERLKLLNRHNYETGDTILLFGKPITLRVNPHKNSVPELNDQELSLGIKTSSGARYSRNTIVAKLEKWYKDQASSVIANRIDHFVPVVGAKPKGFRIKSMKTRWGSCSSRHNLNFNYRIIMAPPSVLDYVVVHEMCHLVHPNHSADFWTLVKKIMPNHKDCHQWLKKNAHRLNL